MQVATYFTVAILLSLGLFGLRSMHVFAARNGLFDHFLGALDKRKMPSGIVLQPVLTGCFPKIDWQILAPLTFMLNFTENLAHPDTVLAGILFLGAWAPAWILMLIESFRACNQGTLATWVMLPGLMIYNHSHAVATPFYLALLLLFAPSAKAAHQNDLDVDSIQLQALVFSFTLGYVVPIFLLAIPAPNVVSWRFKHTVTGWYQQWNAYIAILHLLAVHFLDSSKGMSRSSSPDEHVQAFRSAYVFAFLLAAIPWWAVSVLSWLAKLCPSLMSAKHVRAIQPASIFVPQSPFTTKKCRSMAEGFKWLIQWDHAVGTLATMIWAVYLLAVTSEAYGVEQGALNLLLKSTFYFFIGGPVAVPVALLWERDEIALAARALSST